MNDETRETKWETTGHKAQCNDSLGKLKNWPDHKAEILFHHQEAAIGCLSWQTKINLSNTNSTRVPIGSNWTEPSVRNRSIIVEDEATFGSKVDSKIEIDN